MSRVLRWLLTGCVLVGCEPFEGSAPLASDAGADGRNDSNQDASSDNAGPAPRRYVFMSREVPGDFAKALVPPETPGERAAKICEDDASSVEKLRGKRWAVWLTDSAGTAQSRVVNRGMYEWVSTTGEVVFPRGALANPGKVSPSSAITLPNGDGFSGLVWTGSNEDGGRISDDRTCRDWRVALGFARLGDPKVGAKPGAWSSAVEPICNSAPRPFYCFEQ